ncbi:MAG: pentapeptide repeat-containing protein [Endozoicomonas sp.]
MAKKKGSKKDGSQSAENETGRCDILAKDVQPTKGLSGDNTIKLRGLGEYSIAVKPVKEAELIKSQQEDPLAIIQGLHPGVNVPPHISLKGETLSGLDLERVRFHQNRLNGCDFRKACLRGAGFKRCDLSGADFRGADLRDCIFQGCNMEGADMRGCRLEDIRVVDCNLFAANFDNSCLDNAVIDSCTMGAQSFHNSSCLGVRLYNSHVIHGFFDDCDLSGAELRNMVFRNCTLSNTHFDNALMDECQFRGCDSFQDGPVFSGGSLNNVVMMDCSFHVPKLVGTRISNSVMTRVDLESALLEGTSFNKVVFENGSLVDCYSLEQGPSFNHCRLDHLTIDQAELSNARFDQSFFVGALIRDSDFNAWTMNHTGLDAETSIEWPDPG